MGLIRREVYQFIGQGRVSFARSGVSSHRRCPGLRKALNLHAKGGIAMRRGIRLMALGIAVSVNGAALMAVNAAMVEGAERQLLSQQEPERIVITAPRQEDSAPQTLAIQNCPARKTL